MEVLANFDVINMFLHLDKTLEQVIRDYQAWVYLLLFAIIFCETGLVATPFLPGDSLLFAAGSLAAISGCVLEVQWLLLVLFAAAVMGDSTNYWIGRFVGPKIFSKENIWLLNKKHLEKTHAFYEKHGGKTVVIARFMPIIRTFAPFVAGIGRMFYLKFLSFSVLGTALWVGGFIMGGYFFGNIPFVKKNFTLVILVIIFISLLPGAIAFLREKLRKGDKK